VCQSGLLRAFAVLAGREVVSVRGAIDQPCGIRRPKTCSPAQQSLPPSHPFLVVRTVLFEHDPHLRPDERRNRRSLAVHRRSGFSRVTCPIVKLAFAPRLEAHLSILTSQNGHRRMHSPGRAAFQRRVPIKPISRGAQSRWTTGPEGRPLVPLKYAALKRRSSTALPMFHATAEREPPRMSTKPGGFKCPPVPALIVALLITLAIGSGSVRNRRGRRWCKRGGNHACLPSPSRWGLSDY